MKKVISFIALVGFLLINPVYPDTLRLPLTSNTNVGKDRQEALQRQAFLVKYGLSRFLTEEEALEYLDTVSEVISVHTGQPQAKDSVEQWLRMGTVSIAEKKDDRTKVVCSVPLIKKTVFASNTGLESENRDILASNQRVAERIKSLGTVEDATEKVDSFINDNFDSKKAIYIYGVSPETYRDWRDTGWNMGINTNGSMEHRPPVAYTILNLNHGETKQKSLNFIKGFLTLRYHNRLFKIETEKDGNLSITITDYLVINAEDIEAVLESFTILAFLQRKTSTVSFLGISDAAYDRWRGLGSRAELYTNAAMDLSVPVIYTILGIHRGGFEYWDAEARYKDFFTDFIESVYSDARFVIETSDTDGLNIVVLPPAGKTRLASGHMLTNDAALRQVRALERAGDRDLNKVMNREGLGARQRLNLARNAAAKFEEAQSLVHAQDLEGKRQTINGKLRKARRELRNLTARSERGKRLASNASLDEGYATIAEWIMENSDYKNDIEKPNDRIIEITNELKTGKVVLKKVDVLGDPSYFTNYKITVINFRRGINVYNKGESAIVDTVYGDTQATQVGQIKINEIPEDILNLASEKLDVKVFKKTIDWHSVINSKTQLWKLRLSKMTDDDIGMCLRTLGEDVPVKRSFKRSIAKKLARLQQKRPETIPIIREKALELLEIDEDNFRDGVAPFAKDYIAIRDAIRRGGIKDGTAEFYRLFDTTAITTLKSEEVKLASNASLDELLILAGNPEGGFLGLEKPGLKTDGILAIDIDWLYDKQFRNALEIKLDMLKELKAAGKYNGEVWIVNFSDQKRHDYTSYAEELANRRYYSLMLFKESSVTFQDSLNSLEDGRVILEARHKTIVYPEIQERAGIHKFDARGIAGMSVNIEIKEGFSLDLFALFRALQEERIDRINLERLIIEHTTMESVLDRLDKKTQGVIVSRV